MRYIVIALAAIPLLSGAAAAQTATSVSPEFERAKPTDVLSYNLVGLDIVNDQNQTIGEIKDLLLSQGQLSGYVVSVGGFLGLGERYVVVRPSAVKVTYNESQNKWHAVMNATKDQLKAAPEFKYEGRWKR